MADEDLAFNLGLFVRSGLLVKFLLMAELYKRFVRIPGLLVEFGTWYGQNLVLLENLRAIYEPFNKERRIVGFDSFDGYNEGRLKGLYRAGRKYVSYLNKLIETHERCNVYGHNSGNHELIEGDVCHTAKAYFQAHPEAIVAFAYLDMGPYEATSRALWAIKPHLVPGSILLMDEMTWKEMPGEAVAFKQVFGVKGYRIEKADIYPSKTIVEIL